mmetsp:Transcript_32086/g.73820  ORF Transcript_32086/g.73820 Transcript_32086/m.73820 type:complete len:672 (-) Transcript_32086:188-2203(-)
MKLSAVLVTIVWKALGAYAGGSIVTEGVKHNRDQTPVMGRGYSIATSQMLSSCMHVPDLTNPSFDYAFEFYQLQSTYTSAGSGRPWGSGHSMYQELNQLLGGGNGIYYWAVFQSVLRAVSLDLGRTGSENSSKNYMTALMKADMYYNSGEEATSSMSNDAVGLLSRGEYLGFIQACGPYFIRSIRRTKQIGALFATDTTSSQSSSLTYSYITQRKYSNCWWFICGTSSRSSTSQNQSIQTTSEITNLEISIFGIGLNFNTATPGVLVAKSMADYDDVMAYGFESMKHQRSGLVESIEVVPWVASPMFQVAAQLDVILEDEDCEELTTRDCKGKKCTVNTAPASCTTTCYQELSTNTIDCRDGSSCSPSTCYVESTSDLKAFAYDDVSAFEDCKDTPQKDKFAFFDISFNETNVTYTAVSSTVCESNPDKTYLITKKTFSPSLKMFNYMGNAELIANIDAIVRQKFESLELLSQCIGLLHSYDDGTLDRSWVRNNLQPLDERRYTRWRESRVGAWVTQWGLYSYNDDTITSGDYEHPLGAKRLKFLLTGDNCITTYNTTSCVRPTRFYYGRQIKLFQDYVTGFYAPCLTALSANSLEFDGGKIFTHHWLSLTECNKPTCMVYGSNIGGSDCTLPADLEAVKTSPSSTTYNPAVSNDLEYLTEAYCMPELLEM